MGMFDYFKIDYPLPLESYILAEYRPFVHAVMNQDEFQSKDLHCTLDRYYIDNNGRIYIDESTFEEPKPKMVPIYYHGHIEVYAVVLLEDDINSSKKFWLRYDLKFTDSLLVSAKMISPTKEDIKSLLGSQGSGV
jgi:hypothetical protein